MATRTCLLCHNDRPLTAFPLDGAHRRSVCAFCLDGLDEPAPKKRSASFKKNSFGTDDLALPIKDVETYDGWRGNRVHVTAPPSEIVLAIGDLHTPFQHPDMLPFLVAARDHYKPTKIVLLGDEIDAHAVSDWDHDPDGLSAGHELVEAKQILAEVYKEFPNALVCESNHTFRVAKKAFRVGIPTAWMKHIGDVLDAPAGWAWADHWVVDGVRYEHGESFAGQTGAYRSALHNQQSTVIGHIHSWAGIQYLQTPTSLLFGFNVGCLVNEHAYAFNYAKFVKSRPVIGVGLLDRGTPHFLPMRRDTEGRWTGTL